MRGIVFVPDRGEFVVKGSKAMNRAVDGDLVPWQWPSMAMVLLPLLRQENDLECITDLQKLRKVHKP